MQLLDLVRGKRVIICGGPGGVGKTTTSAAIAAGLAMDGRRVAVIALSFLPAVAVGLALEEQIDRRLGGPRSTAFGLIAGSVAMALTDRCPQDRNAGEATPADGLAIGFAQAAALVPGVSRNGSTLAAARAA